MLDELLSLSFSRLLVCYHDTDWNLQTILLSNFTPLLCVFLPDYTSHPNTSSSLFHHFCCCTGSRMETFKIYTHGSLLLQWIISPGCCRFVSESCCGNHKDRPALDSGYWLGFVLTIHPNRTLFQTHLVPQLHTAITYYRRGRVPFWVWLLTRFVPHNVSGTFFLATVTSSLFIGDWNLVLDLLAIWLVY